jgi:hypothetical protein
MPRFNLILEKPAIGYTAIVEASDAAEAADLARRDHPGATVRMARLIPEGFDPKPIQAEHAADAERVFPELGRVSIEQTFRVSLNVPAPGSYRLVNASSAEEAIAIVNRDNPGLASGAQPAPAPRSYRAIADKRRSDDGLREARLEELLGQAESFIAGFEGDDTQEEPVDDLLEAIRKELA